MNISRKFWLIKKASLVQRCPLSIVCENESYKNVRLLVEVLSSLVKQKGSKAMATNYSQNLRELAKFLKNDVSKRAIKYRVDIINHG